MTNGARDREMDHRDRVEVYDRLHEHLEKESREGALTSYWHILAQEHLGEIAGQRVLEIGCGRGEFARYLCGLGANVVAADFSPAAVEITRRRLEGCEQAEAFVADIEDIPFPDQSFDVVVSLETLEHVSNPDRALNELVRVTRRGGRLIITTPNYLNFHGLYRVFLALFGRHYAEAGNQPVNHPMILIKRVSDLKRLGCRIDSVDGRGLFLPIPKLGSVELKRLERVSFMKWFALESLTSATRL